MDYQDLDNTYFVSINTMGENNDTFQEFLPYSYKAHLGGLTGSNDSPFLNLADFDFSPSQSHTPSLSPQTTSLDPPPAEMVRKPTKCKTFCTKCNKNLNRSQDLKRHKLVHTGIRNFKCEPCGGSFSRKDALKRHQRTCTSCSSSS
ncbi:hypothetical protein INT47_008970 [Mucor saturninus]|uniref:C2H2-type domain-containing protein n=1 Tax=Mucor saturninus TaxID=64648 RepID=A0A8H7R2A4_9FUNG|nr:hypothetical protein INT47_008970 [Mucor saturninus]